MSLTLTGIIQIKIMTDVMRWLAKAALKGACSSKEKTIKKVIPRNAFSFQQILSLKKKNHYPSQSLKKNTIGLEYLEHQLLCNHR